MATNDPIAFSDEELAALLRDATVSPEAIASEMQEAGAPALAPAALATARRLLALDPADVALLSGLPDKLRTFIVDEAIAQKAATFVGALAASSDKATVKEAKRAMHLLRTQGVKVEVPRSAPPPAPAPAPVPVAEEFPTIMTIVDGFGERVLFIPCPLRNGVDVAQIVLSDETGLSSASLVPLARKEYRKFLQNLEKSGVTVGEVPRAYARGLVTKALDDAARARRPVPAGFNEVSFALGPSVTPQPSPGRTLALPEDAAQLALLGRELCALAEMSTWLPAKEALTALAQRFDEIAQSALYVDEDQKEAARVEAVDSAVRAYWTPQRRGLTAERLFDVAWVLNAVGRVESARLTLSHANAVASDRPIEAVAFAFALFEKVAGELRSARLPAVPARRAPVPSLIVPG